TTISDSTRRRQSYSSFIVTRQRSLPSRPLKTIDLGPSNASAQISSYSGLSRLPTTTLDRFPRQPTQASLSHDGLKVNIHRPSNSAPLASLKTSRFFAPSFSTNHIRP